MNRFDFYNPVKIVFGKETIPSLKDLIPSDKKVMLLYGGGSIRKNGVYDQVTDALGSRDVIEFSGIEANPEFETCLKAVEKARTENVEFLLAVGGGSVIDATKFIAAAIPLEDKDPWMIMTGKIIPEEAVPFGTVLTLPATGSEMNAGSVISRRSINAKLPFSSPYVFPQFSILDPETTYSLPDRQVANGIVDAFVHVIEQYLTFDVNAPLQDRQAEAILKTLIEIGRKTLDFKDDYESRATLMWCATSALNSVISCGVPQDWTTHMIGHELTAHFGLDHAQSLAVVLPAVMEHQRHNKKDKLILYAERIFGITGLDANSTIDLAISNTVDFFRSLGVKTKLSKYDITLDATSGIPEIMGSRGFKYGERSEIGGQEISEILKLAE